MSAIKRRYDIDWLRVIAIGLLLVYHVAIAFQPWGTMIGFITTKQSWNSLWIPMAMLNVWRIPLLFFVSGMGVYFALQQRNWKQLMRERAGRILLPFLFGMFFIVPLHVFIWQSYYHLELTYSYNPGHLWFLGNIFIYVVVLSPVFFYLKRNEEGKIAKRIKMLLANPLGLLIAVAAFVAEAILVDPRPFELYAMTWHGFFLGLLAFFFGFCFVLCGPAFWQMIVRWRWFLFAFAATLCVSRVAYFQQFSPNYLVAIESNLWVFSVFAFGSKYLNRPGKTLSYLSQAAYPVYILHMVFLFLGSMVVFPWKVAPQVGFFLVLLITILGCFVTYELIRRINFLRPFFGLKKLPKSDKMLSWAPEEAAKL